MLEERTKSGEIPYCKGPVPPEAVMVILPFASPLQVALTAVAVAVIGTTGLILKEAVLVHPLVCLT
ncbi:hypothetical protein D3C86_1390690 [compost metagenome]